MDGGGSTNNCCVYVWVYSVVLVVVVSVSMYGYTVVVLVLVISKIMYEGKIVNLINLDVLSRRRAPLRAARASGRREVNRSFRVS